MIIDEEMLDKHNFDVPDLVDTIRDAWRERDEARELLRWAVTYLIPGEGKDELIQAIDKHLGIRGRRL